MGGANRARRAGATAPMALYVLAMTVVFDLDAPQRGGIIVNQGPMQVLIETLEEIAPRATEP